MHPSSVEEWTSFHNDRTVDMAHIRLVSRRCRQSASGSQRLASGALARLTIAPVAAPEFPDRLRNVKSAPSLVWLVGNDALLHLPAFSLCGSRAASERGLKWARFFGEQVAAAGAVLVTGLARGVDTEATLGAIQNGGSAIGVLAEGIMNWTNRDLDTPVGNGSLLLVSEFRPSAKWTPGQAMQRNLTICALGSAMFVIEAGEKGGTLAAGRTALRCGRPLFAIRYPENPIGNEILLTEGAQPLERASDLVRVLSGSRDSTKAEHQ